MGGDHSTSQQFNILKLNEWQVLQESNHLRILGNRKNVKETIEEHPISFSDQKNLEIAQQLYHFRNNDSELVSTTHFNVQKQQEMCSKSYSGNLYTQHIPIRLSNIVHVPFPDILHLYNQCFNGFQRLSRRLGPFKINEDCIGVNLNHIAKVWHSPNFSQNQPQAKVQSQYELVRNVVSVIEQNTDMSSMPRQQPLFSEFLYRQNQKVGFAEAKRKLELYANYFNQGVIPKYLSCVQRAGGAIEIKNKWNQNNITDKKNSKIFTRQVFNSQTPIENTNTVLPVQAHTFNSIGQQGQRVSAERWERYDNFAPKARSRIQYPQIHQNPVFSPPPIINNNRPNLILSSRVNQVEPPRISHGSGINSINGRILSPQPSISALSRPVTYQQYNNFTSPPPSTQYVNVPPKQANFQKNNQSVQPVLISNQQPQKNTLVNNLSERKLTAQNLVQNNVAPLRTPTQVAVIEQPLRVNKIPVHNIIHQTNIQQNQVLSNSSLPSAPVNTQVSIPQQKPPSQTTIISNQNLAPQVPSPAKPVSSSQSNILNSSQNHLESQSPKNKTSNQIVNRQINQTGIQSSSISINNQSINGVLQTNPDNSPAKNIELASSKQLKLVTGQQPWMAETLTWQYQQNFGYQKPLSPLKQGFSKENYMISPQKKLDYNQQNRYSPNIINSHNKIESNTQFFVQKHFNLHEANSASSKYNVDEHFYSPQRTLNAMTKNIDSIDVKSAARSSFQANPQPNQSISQIVTKQNNYIDQNVFSTAKQEQSINTSTKNYSYGYDWNNYNVGDYSTYKYNIEKQIGGYNSFNYNSYDYQSDNNYGKQTAQFTKVQNKVDNGGYNYNQYYGGRYDSSNYIDQKVYVPKYSYESRQQYRKYDEGQLTSGYKVTQKDTNQQYERTSEDLVSGKKTTQTNKLTGLTSNHFDNNLDLKQSVIEEESYNVQWDPQILADLQANIHHN